MVTVEEEPSATRDTLWAPFADITITHVCLSSSSSATVSSTPTWRNTYRFEHVCLPSLDCIAGSTSVKYDDLRVST